MSVQHAPYLNEIGTLLAHFEGDFEKSLKKGEELKRQMLKILEPFPKSQIPSNLSGTCKQILGEAFNHVGRLNAELEKWQRDYVRQSKLAKRFEDKFLVVLVGRVKQGKTTLCDCLATIFEKGLGRPVERFRLDEPTEEVPVEKAEGKEIYAAYLHDLLDPMRREGGSLDIHILWEKLKSKGFVLDHEAVTKLIGLGISKVHIACEGDYIERKIEKFEISVLEVPKMQGFVSGGLCVLDAPGLASGNDFSRRRARGMWLASDMAVYLCSQDTPLQATDLDLLKEHAGSTERSIIFVISKCDHYYEDEEDGMVVSKWEFGRDAYNKQKAWVRQVLIEKGLEHLFVESEVLGVSSMLFKVALEKGGSGSLEKAMAQGRYDDFMKRLLTALKSEGLRRKTQAPLERAKVIAEEIIDHCEKNIEEIKRHRDEKIPQLQQKGSRAVENFSKKALEHLTILAERRFAEAKKRVSPERVASVEIESDEFRRVFQECARDAAQEFNQEIQCTMSELRLPNVRGSLKEHWKKVVRRERRKVGRTRTGRVAGGVIGGLVGSFFGPWWAPIVTCVIGEVVGSGFDSDEYVTATRKTNVRVGDNFDEVWKNFSENIKKSVDDASAKLAREIDTAIDVVKNSLDAVVLSLEARKRDIREKILRREYA